MADASDAELAAKADEGIARLRRCAADPFVPDFAKDATLLLVLFRFKGVSPEGDCRQGFMTPMNLIKYALNELEDV